VSNSWYPSFHFIPEAGSATSKSSVNFLRTVPTVTLRKTAFRGRVVFTSSPTITSPPLYIMYTVGVCRYRQQQTRKTKIKTLFSPPHAESYRHVGTVDIEGGLWETSETYEDRASHSGCFILERNACGSHWTVERVHLVFIWTLQKLLPNKLTNKFHELEAPWRWPKLVGAIINE
jgi:hypothetical protein